MAGILGQVCNEGPGPKLRLSMGEDVLVLVEAETARRGEQLTKISLARAAAALLHETTPLPGLVIQLLLDVGICVFLREDVPVNEPLGLEQPNELRQELVLLVGADPNSGPIQTPAQHARPANRPTQKFRAKPDEMDGVCVTKAALQQE